MSAYVISPKLHKTLEAGLTHFINEVTKPQQIVWPLAETIYDLLVQKQKPELVPLNVFGLDLLSVLCPGQCVAHVPFLKGFRNGSAVTTIDLEPAFLQVGLCQH